jgi:protein phosphatase
VRHGSRAAAPVVRVAGPALVLVLGLGAEDAARRAFLPEELVAPDGDPGPWLRAGALVAVALDVPDRATVQRLLAAAREEDSAVDAVLLGPAPPFLRRSGVRVTTQPGAADFAVERVRADWDRTDLGGPFDVVGDVHGCLPELLLLLARLGYEVSLDDRGRPAGARHADGRTAVFAGDLVDRGPDVPGVLRLVLGMLGDGSALAVTGNHDDKLRRALLGHDVQVGGGLEVSLEQLAREPAGFRAAVVEALGALPVHLVLDGGRLLVAHAGLAERYHGRESARVRALCLYGPTTGATDEHGLPVRLPWADEYRGRATVVYGHTPTAERELRHGTACVDGGCVFGGALVALRYPEREFAEVAATARHSVPGRPFLPAG